MKKKVEYPASVELVTIKVTRDAAYNFKLAAANSGKRQYEVSEEGSCFVLGKYLRKKQPIKTKKNKIAEG